MEASVKYTRKTNEALRAAGQAKKDEFYTPYEVIENEIKHCSEFFLDKNVLCNGNDSDQSNFYRYFRDHFEELQLRSLTCISHNPQGQGQKIVLTAQGESRELLKGDGDFRSEEAIEFLKATDIVVTNPPFSLFAEFLLQLLEYNKDFLILGNITALSHKRIFPFIKEGRVHLGQTIRSGGVKFYVPDEYPLNATVCGVDDEGRHFIRVAGVRWYTSLRFYLPEKPLELSKTYSPEEYPKFDTFDAINIDKTKDIPVDYPNYMGVPITYFDKHDPDRFDLVGILSFKKDSTKYVLGKPILNGKCKFNRLVIKRREA